MWDYNKWLQLLGISTTITVIFLLFCLVGLIGSTTASADLASYEEVEERIIPNSSMIPSPVDVQEILQNESGMPRTKESS